MDSVAQNQLATAYQGQGPNVYNLFRQVGLLVGVAAAIAIGVVVGLWTYTPNYEPLYGSLAEREVSMVVEALRRRNVDFRLDEQSGSVMVAASKVREVRLQLASEGLPKSSGVGFEILQQKQEFGTSQFREMTRYQHALESELARSIMTLGNVRSARVHLALPKQTVFVRKRRLASASVLLNLFSGRMLEDEQIAAISHLVASSIPDLEPTRVTVIDSTGRLLSGKRRTTNMALNQDQFDYTRRLEQSYIERIEEILLPLVGAGRVRAQVTADVDFTVSEQTQELYNPDITVPRSEQINEENSTMPGAGGIPGALSNQPPLGGAVPEVATGPGVIRGAGAGAEATSPVNSRRSSTINYETDRTINHSRMSSGVLKRLSIAVVVDEGGAAGARSAEDINSLMTLVREAVGYSELRGDTVNVTSASFAKPDPIEALPDTPVWEAPWVIDIAKLLLGTVVVVLLIFLVLRPTLRNLAITKMVSPDGSPAGADAGMADDQLTLGGDGVKLPSPGAYEENVQLVQKTAQEDPKLVAQVVKNWIGNE